LSIVNELSQSAEGLKEIAEKQNELAAKLPKNKLDVEQKEKEPCSWEEVLFLAREYVLQKINSENCNQTTSWDLKLFLPENPKESLHNNKLAWEFIFNCIVDQEISNKSELKKLISLIVYLADDESMNPLLQIVEKKISQVSPLEQVSSKGIFTPREEIYYAALEAAATCDKVAVFEDFLMKISEIKMGRLTTLWKRVVLNDSKDVAEKLLTVKEDSRKLPLLWYNSKNGIEVFKKIVKAFPEQLKKIIAGENILGNALSKENATYLKWILFSTNEHLVKLRSDLLAPSEVLEKAGNSDPESFYWVIAAYKKLQLKTDKELKRAIDRYVENNFSSVGRVLESVSKFDTKVDPILLCWVIVSFEKIDTFTKSSKINVLKEFILINPVESVKNAFDAALKLKQPHQKVLFLFKEAVKEALEENELDNEKLIILKEFLGNPLVEAASASNNSQKIISSESKELYLKAQEKYRDAVETGDTRVARKLLRHFSENKFWDVTFKSLNEELLPKNLYLGSKEEAIEDYSLAVKQNNYELAQSIILKFSNERFWVEGIKTLTETDLEDMEIVLIKLQMQILENLKEIS